MRFDHSRDQPDHHISKASTKEFFQDLYSARRIRDVLLPVCLESSPATRERLREEFVKRGAAESVTQAGQFLSLVSQQIGMAKNHFLRQVLGYEYPNYAWEKDNYYIRQDYDELVAEVLSNSQSLSSQNSEGL